MASEGRPVRPAMSPEAEAWAAKWVTPQGGFRHGADVHELSLEGQKEIMLLLEWFIENTWDKLDESRVSTDAGSAAEKAKG